MKIGPIQPAGQPQKPENINKRAEKAPDRVKPHSDSFEQSKPEQVLTYKRPAGKVEQATIEKLWAESERTYESLRRLVEQLLLRQGRTLETLGDGAVTVDEEARAEAAALIADDGPLGAESVSERIVDFAKAISGGDPSKIGVLRDAIEEGFRQASQMLGGLPEVSLRTYDLVMEKLAAWENGE